MRIGVLTTSYPRHADDWAGRFVADLSCWLADAGDRVEVLAPEPAATVDPRVTVHALHYARRPRLLYGAGAPDNLLGSQPFHRRATAWAQVPAFVGRLALACMQRQRDWDAVISHWLLPCGVVAARAASRRPHLAIAHSSDVHLLPRIPAAGLLLDALIRPRSALALTSEPLRGALLARARSHKVRSAIERAPVLPMGIHLPHLPRAPQRAAWRAEHGLDDRPLLVFVGRLVPVKGLDRLLRAAAGLDVQLVVVGDGPQRDRLQRESSAVGSATHFVGAQGLDQKWRWLHAADMLVLPSIVLPDGRTDSVPVVALEAMAAGLPVVASAVGGLGDVIDDGVTGLLVPHDSEGALRAAIRLLARDGQLRAHLGSAARRRAEAFSWERIGARLRQLLLDL